MLLPLFAIEINGRAVCCIRAASLHAAQQLAEREWPRRATFVRPFIEGEFAMAREYGDPKAWPIGTRVRFQPGPGTYGYEDVLEADGRIPAIVVGHTPTRVQISMRLRRSTVTRSVADFSLVAAP